MLTEIFCPSSHLILSARRCPHCGWERPPDVGLGQVAWGPVDLGAGLGGPGRAVYTRPAVVAGVLAIPLRNGELVGLSLVDGRILWRSALDAGHMARSLAAQTRPQGARLLAAISDERNLEQAGPGKLVALDPHTGQHLDLWQPQASFLSPLTLVENLVLLRSSAPELIALTLEPQPTIAWRQPLQTWWAQPPAVIHVAGLGSIVLAPDGRPMHGSNELKAFRLVDGSPLWQQVTDSLLSFSPVLAGEVLVYRDGHKSLVGLDPLNGQVLWRHELAHMYSNLVGGPEHFYLAARGAVNRDQPGYYQVQAWAPGKPELIWQSTLPERVRILHQTEDQVLLMGSDDGSLLAFLPGRDEPLWQHRLGSAEDPIQTELVIADGLLLAGAYSGRLIAIRVSPSLEPSTDPQTFINKGQWEAAAAVYALNGDLAAAARLYAGQPGGAHKAMLLYEAGGFYQQAGELARAQKWNEHAVDFFERAGNQRLQAETLLDMGDLLGAAAAYERAGELSAAARLYLKTGELRKAWNLYKELGDWVAVIGLLPTMTFLPDDIDWLERSGRYLEAAGAARRSGWLEKAVKLYQKGGDQQGEFETLIELSRQKPEEWSLIQLAGLARRLGRFPVEAQAWEKLDGRSQEAADAYQRAANQAIQVEPGQEDLIAAYFEKAAAHYHLAGMELEEESARSQVVYYRRLPQVIVEGRTAKAFREKHSNTLELVIRNVGRGLAYRICVQVGEDDDRHFAVDEKTCLIRVDRLAPLYSKAVEVFIVPRPGQVGDEVPLLLRWSWEDHSSQGYHQEILSKVQVKSLEDLSKTDAPVVIHAQTYVQGTLIGGDQVQGDQIHGDQVQPEGQKGDRVTIQRGAATISPSGATPASQASCPNCRLPVNLGEPFCTGCGFELAKTKKPAKGRPSV